MSARGQSRDLSDLGSVTTWDGRYLPGPWLVHQAMRGRTRHGCRRITSSPSSFAAAITSRACRRICRQATDAGLVLLLMCSDPAAAGVTPHGGVASRITPNPLAAGIPTDGEPMLIDISMSTTTNAMTRRVASEGGRLPGPWVVDADGRATDDPSVLFGERPGAVLPLGGLDLGHKGFALALAGRGADLGAGGPRPRGRADASGARRCSCS